MILNCKILSNFKFWSHFYHVAMTMTLTIRSWLNLIGKFSSSKISAILQLSVSLRISYCSFIPIDPSVPHSFIFRISSCTLLSFSLMRHKLWLIRKWKRSYKCDCIMEFPEWTWVDCFHLPSFESNICNQP